MRGFLTLLCALLAGSPAVSLAADQAGLCAALASGDVARADSAVSVLCGECDAATFPLLRAAVEGRLRVRGGRLFAAEEGGALAPLDSLGQDPKSASDTVAALRLTRRQLARLRSVEPLTHLGDASPAARAEAYGVAARLNTPQALRLLELVVRAETDPAAAEAGRQALATLQLAHGGDGEQAQALDDIEEWSLQDKFNGPEAHDALATYLARTDLSKGNRAAADHTLRRLDQALKNNQICQNIFSGLSLGSILVLIALGLSIIYGLAGIINMSHGEFLMIGAYTTYCLQQLFEACLPASLFDVAFFAAMPLSFVTTAAMGLLVERLVIRHLYNRPLESLLATWGVSLILIQLARTIFGDLTTVRAPAVLSGGLHITEGFILPYNRLFIIVVSAVVVLCVWQLLRRSRLGVDIRAVTQNRSMSACVGIDTRRVDMTTFALGSGLAGVAGWAMTLIGNVVPDMGQTYIVDSFLVVVTGGVGKLMGCVASGLGIGVLTKVFEAGFEAVYGKVLMLLLIIIFLQYRPKGLFADKGRSGDD